MTYELCILHYFIARHHNFSLEWIVSYTRRKPRGSWHFSWLKKKKTLQAKDNLSPNKQPAQLLYLFLLLYILILTYSPHWTPVLALTALAFHSLSLHSASLVIWACAVELNGSRSRVVNVIQNEAQFTTEFAATYTKLIDLSIAWINHIF